MATSVSDVLSEFADADAFLDSLLQETEVAPKSHPVVASTAESRQTESVACNGGDSPNEEALAQGDSSTGAEYDRLELTLVNSQEEKPSRQQWQSAQEFNIDDGEEDGLTIEEDSSLLQLPSIPGSFSAEDVAMREALVDFYRSHNSQNLEKVNDIVQTYRCGGACDLWASLGVKYELSPISVLDALGNTLYAAAPLQRSPAEDPIYVDSVAAELLKVHAGDLNALMQAALACGSSGVLRALVRHGAFQDGQRPVLWKVLLNYLPLTHFSEFNAMREEKRNAYAQIREQLLTVSETGVQVRADVSCAASELEGRCSLLEVLQNEIDNIGEGIEMFQTVVVRNSLLALLFVYAHLNPDIRYIQGMNNIVAVIVYAIAPDSVEVEADAFWCFSGFMVEAKERFLENLDETNCRVHKLVGTSGSLLSRYDPDLARHLANCDLEPGIFALRWFSLFFARDLALSQVAQLWDALFVDPQRFDLCDYCCVAVILSCREELMTTANVIVLAEVLQSAPSKAPLDVILKKAWAICALERREQSPPFPQLSAADMVQEVAGAFFTGLFNRF